MAGIDHELGIREAAIGGNPRIAQQKYAQSKDFLDLLVAQKVSNDYASARNAMQAAMQTPANTVKNQLDVSNAQTTKNEMMRSVMPGVAQKAQQNQQAMARQAMGVPTQPARQAMGVPTQPAPNIRMRDGGIVGYANRGLVGGAGSGRDVEGAGSEGLWDKIKRYPQYSDETGIINKAYPDWLQTLRRYLPDQAQNAAWFTNEILAPQLKNDPKTRERFNAAFREARDAGQERFMFDGNDFHTRYVEEMAGGGIVGYANRGLVRAEDVDMDTLLDSLMFAESSGNPRAVGPVGEKGPYQISAPTARQPGFGVSPIDEEDLFDPEKSRRFARQYLQAMIDRYDGDIEAALIAYNAGYGNADKFIAAGRDYDVLPQTETTKPHVKNILDRMEQEGRRGVNVSPGRINAERRRALRENAPPSSRQWGDNIKQLIQESPNYLSRATGKNVQLGDYTDPAVNSLVAKDTPFDDYLGGRASVGATPSKQPDILGYLAMLQNTQNMVEGADPAARLEGINTAEQFDSPPTTAATQAQLMADALGFGSVEEGRADFARRKAARRNTSPTPAEEKTYAPGVGGDLAEIQDFLGRILGFQGGGIVGFTPGGEGDPDPEFRMQGVEADNLTALEEAHAAEWDAYRALNEFNRTARDLGADRIFNRNISNAVEAQQNSLRQEYQDAISLHRQHRELEEKRREIEQVEKAGIPVPTELRNSFARLSETLEEPTGTGEVADPFNVEDMVDRLGDPEFRMQGIVRDAEPTQAQLMADALGYDSMTEGRADFARRKTEREAERQAIEDAKWSADDIDWGRLQAFLAGGGGRTTTAGALGGGLRGLMAEDQRREALDLEERLTMADIGAERYGAELDLDAVMATLDAEQQQFVMEMQQDTLDAYTADRRETAEGHLTNIQKGTDEEYNRQAMLLQETYKNDPRKLADELFVLTEVRLSDLMGTWRGEAGGGGTIGAFDTDISEAGA